MTQAEIKAVIASLGRAVAPQAYEAAAVRRDDVSLVLNSLKLAPFGMAFSAHFFNSHFNQVIPHHYVTRLLACGAFDGFAFPGGWKWRRGRTAYGRLFICMQPGFLFPTEALP